ncbi:COG1361 S-layer family protein [Halalkalicoccus salilacus]|uniref:COG1361 S-layer family protein n=1 Tax=Halalkalicoccus salilacus TaxID=3117459 RepID=UPI00300EFBEE
MISGVAFVQAEETAGTETDGVTTVLETEEIEIEDAQTEDTQTEDTQTDTQTEDTQTDTQTEDTQTEDTQTEDTQTEDTQTEDTQAENAQTEDTQSGDAQGENAQTEDAQTGDDQTENIQAGNAQIGTTQAEGSPEFEVYAPDNTVSPGEETSISITLENRGDVNTGGNEAGERVVTEARGVTAEAEPGDAPITVNTGTQQLGSIQQGSTATQTVDITVDGDASPGTYEVPIELTYTYTPETDGGTETDEVTTTETVTTEIVVDESSQFEIEGATSDVAVGSSGESTIDITNTGPDDASEAVVTLEAPDSNLSIVSQNNQIYIGDWAAGETEAINFVTELSDDALPQDYTIYATVEYLDENGNEQTSRELRTGLATDTEQTFSVDNVQSDLWVGEDGRVTAEVTNEGPNEAENVVLLLAEEGSGSGQAGILSGLGGDDSEIGLGDAISARETQYSVGSLDPGESATVEFPLAVSSEAEAGQQAVAVTTRYRTPTGDVETSAPIDMTLDIREEREIFSVETNQSAADANSTNSSESTATAFNPGTTESLELVVTNDYDQTLTNVQAQTYVDDPLTISDGEAFIPELEPGETAVLEFDLEVASGADSQMYPVEIDFQYADEDDSGQLSETYRVPVTVTEAEDDGPGWLIAVVLVLLLLAAIAWWFRDDIRTWYGSLDRS